MTLTPVRIRRGLAGLAVACSPLLLASCGTSFSAQTNQPYQAAAGANDRFTGVDGLNALVVDNGDGTGTLSMGLVNSESDADTLGGVTAEFPSSDDAIDVTFESPVELVHDELVILGEEPEVVLNADSLASGQYVKLELQFQNAPPLSMEVPVVTRENTELYDEIAEAPETPVDEGSVPQPNGDNPAADSEDEATSGVE